MPKTVTSSKVLKYQFKSFEKLPTRIWKNASEASIHVAQSIALAIRQKQQEGELIVLGLATGSSPIKIYNELVRMHKEEGLSFQNVVTFNLDEYYPMPPDANQSYVRFMREYLFDHIDIKPEHVNIPDGTISMDDIGNYCQVYEQKIDSYGGIDIQLLGIGRTGHIGFNEPGSWENSLTRLVKLDALTRQDATKDFILSENVPYRAITMGIGSIFKAKKIFLVAWGTHKASIINKAIEGPISENIPSTFLQKHPNISIILDTEAAGELTRIKTPWLIGLCNWNKELITKAVIWLAQEVKKPLLKLTDEDYNEHGLSDLVVEYQSAYKLNIEIFNRLQHTITGWPGGKPNADDSTRPERATPTKKRVIIFSPHPDDDVISMGGTFLRLVEHGHDVHVAYQTSGNIAVHDHDALRFLEFYKEFGLKNVVEDQKISKSIDKLLKQLRNKDHGQSDSLDIRNVKGLIRRGEARAGARFCGLPNNRIHFLDMPFYETGRVRKKPLSKVDIEVVENLIREVKPHQIFAAGDLADPHGTHRVCLEAIFRAYQNLKNEKWLKDSWLWLYRGAWHEWDVHEIQMAVPLSPEELLKKRKAIFMHQSQKDRPPFPGSDVREFWQRAEDRNRMTAKIYNQLGLAEYEAIEAFVRWTDF